ncbi:Acetyltransferase (GNAT) family protein [Pseudovibrio sp. Ad13]|uniref:GNAT family N-acetyltransferase n=1 Tax=unclassified Pseudovibrio TaxID=2627060 RepID=UPI0007AE74FB|nr:MULTISPECIES: GNAT family N-acetyltransferase [unclassified Pseudovibrio]KZK87037.1 Acetyltransferase (GNAT) family protein [Pseudovibrio sp. Ad13]KZK95911.1 Acetyltransferase (GNAT) family protein [Pseudovibrio sp. Ad46]
MRELEISFRSIPATLTYKLRQQVLWPDSPIERVMVPEDHQALHIGAFEEENLIGVGSFFFDLPSVRLRKLAVLPEKQGRGIGSSLIRFAANQPDLQKVDNIWCDARADAVSFYQRLGFKFEGDAFQKFGVSYLRARVELAQLSQQQLVIDEFLDAGPLVTH